MLENMSHRGATGNNKKIGDGAGIKTQIPHKLLVKELSEKNILLPGPGKYALGMFFFQTILGIQFFFESSSRYIIKIWISNYF